MEEKCFTLLEYKQNLDKTGEYLSLEKEKGLLNYQSKISDHFRWEKKPFSRSHGRFLGK